VAAGGQQVTAYNAAHALKPGRDRHNGEHTMSDGRLVLLGLNALARAHERDHFADGHRGAAMVAAHLLCEENALDDRARKRIEALVDMNWSKTSLCAGFPEEAPRPERIEEIGIVLAEGADTLRQVGHNVIFAMLAIKGFRLMPEAATPARIDGICRLIPQFTPWRDVEPDPEVAPPPFEDTAAASRFVLREACNAIDRFTGFGQGYAGHMLTFGQAIVELAATGDVVMAERCRNAFRKYVTVTRLGPEPDARAIPDHPHSNLRPLEATYWDARGDHDVDIGHVFKYPYSCYNLLRRADDPDLARAWEERADQLF
jgi:hypothetical protein